MISHFHEMVFVHIPKCAGMSVEQALGGLPQDQRLSQHWSSQTLRRYHPTEWSAYRRFAVVRHPYDRSLSMVRFLRRYDPIYRRHLQHVSDAELLLDLLMGHNLLTEHTSDRMLTDDVTVLKFESLAHDWRRFVADETLPTVLPHTNSAPNAAAPQGRERVLRHAVAAAFPEDHTRFGYPLAADVGALSLAERGVVAWTQLHAWARAVPSQPSPSEQQHALVAVERWVDELPHPDWRDAYCRIVRALPVDATSARGARLWASALHDAVNEALGKPAWNAWSP